MDGSKVDERAADTTPHAVLWSGRGGRGGAGGCGVRECGGGCVGWRGAWYVWVGGCAPSGTKLGLHKGGEQRWGHSSTQQQGTSSLHNARCAHETNGRAEGGRQHRATRQGKGEKDAAHQQEETGRRKPNKPKTHNNSFPPWSRAPHAPSLWCRPLVGARAPFPCVLEKESRRKRAPKGPGTARPVTKCAVGCPWS